MLYKVNPTGFVYFWSKLKHNWYKQVLPEPFSRLNKKQVQPSPGSTRMKGSLFSDFGLSPAVPFRNHSASNLQRLAFAKPQETPIDPPALRRKARSTDDTRTSSFLSSRVRAAGEPDLYRLL